MRELEELKVRVDPCRIRCRIWMLCWENRRDIELNSEKSIRDIQALLVTCDVGDLMSVTIRNFLVKLTIEKGMSKAVSSIRSFSRIINEHRLQQIEEIDMIRRCYPNTIFLEIRLEFEIIKTNFTLDGQKIVLWLVWIHLSFNHLKWKPCKFKNTSSGLQFVLT